MSEPKPPSDCIAQELRAEVESLVAHGDLPGEQMMRACLEMERLEAEIERLRAWIRVIDPDGSIDAARATDE